MKTHRSTSTAPKTATRQLWRNATTIGLVMGLLQIRSFAQTAFTWQQIRDKFEAANPTLKAAQLTVEESRAAEITAYLRPNPDFNFSTDGTQLTPYGGVWTPIAGTQKQFGVSYLLERQGKRELRRDSARGSTAITQSTYSDQERSLLFNLRSAFVGLLQAKAVLQNARDNLDYWDRELEVSRRRFNAGDLAQVDLNRLELQRVQFEADFETAMVNLRTAKIQLLTLLNDRTPIDRFDVTGPYDFSDLLMPLEEFRNAALAARPDLRAAVQNVDLAKVNHQLAIANGSTDPTLSAWYTRNPSFNNPNDYNTIGASINIPLRIFDRNQGEKARTLVDIGRNRISISFQNGGASLLDFLDAEKAYRDTRLAYLNLIGSYLTAAAQMNLAVGREVL